MTLLRDTAHLRLPGYALLVGVSRKRVVGQATGVEKAADRMLGTVAANVAAIAGGCDIIRVHDVLECVESAKMADAIFRQSAKGRARQMDKILIRGLRIFAFHGVNPRKKRTGSFLLLT